MVTISITFQLWSSIRTTEPRRGRSSSLKPSADFQSSQKVPIGADVNRMLRIAKRAAKENAAVANINFESGDLLFHIARQVPFNNPMPIDNDEGVEVFRRLAMRSGLLELIVVMHPPPPPTPPRESQDPALQGSERPRTPSLSPCMPFPSSQPSSTPTSMPPPVSQPRRPRASGEHYSNGLAMPARLMVTVDELRERFKACNACARGMQWLYCYSQPSGGHRRLTEPFMSRWAHELCNRGRVS